MAAVLAAGAQTQVPVLVGGLGGNVQSIVANGDNNLNLDNVTVGETLLCSNPTLLTVGEVTSSTATLSWSTSGDVTAWQVEYVAQHQVYGTTYLAPDSGITVMVYDTPTVILTGLQDNTLYDVSVTAICDSGVTSGSPSVTFTTQMEPVVLPYSTDFSETADYNWLINNGSGMNHWHIGTFGTTPALYITSDYYYTPQYVVSSTSIVSAIKTLAVGAAEEILISFDILCGGEEHYDFIKLFLAPVTEEYPASTSTYAATYASATNSMYAYDFTEYLQYSTCQDYPYKFNLTDGNTVHVDAVMPNPNLSPDNSSAANLVFLWRNDFSGGTQPGTIITNLSVQPLTCHKPDSLAVDTVADHTALVSWVAGGGETAWNLEYKPDTSSTWMVVPVTTTTYTLTGLISETTYSVRVQSDCGGGDLSLYAYESFTTLPGDTPEPCDAPTGLDTTTVANETIGITWNNADVASWNVHYRAQNGEWISMTSATNSCSVTGLTGLTTYEIQVQAVCADGQTSDWSASLFVTTKNVGIDSWLANSVNLYPNPAKEYVDIRVDGEVNVTMMEVYDVYGKLVNTVNVVDNPTRIDVSALADGMYFVRVTTEAGVVTKSFVKK